MAIFTNRTKKASSKLLKEDTDYLLLETGSKIILSRGTAFASRSKNSTGFTSRAKQSTSFTNRA